MSEDKTSISGVSNSVVNTGSVGGSITNAVTLAGLEAKQSDKEDILLLSRQLEDAIKNLPADKIETAETLSKRLKSIMLELDGKKPDKDLVRFSLDGLKKAAESVQAIAPIILTTSIEIAKRIQPFL